MRQIKFRYRIDITESYSKWEKTKIITKIYTLQQIENNILEKDGIGWIAPKILSRDLWTGLPDKNGKEIYEGDIIYEGYSKRSFRKWTFEDWTGAEEWGIIEYRNGMFVINYYSIYGGEGYGRLDERVRQMKRFRVIGNIYENPELLKGA